ncbi:MAG TPA: diphosphomevalonate decarboxylase [Candidatus Bathyarchaeia archaeon]|nr:diphosphomevalonate decarboxylase [Candidatus Bathyarchaeia archaeon]
MKSTAIAHAIQGLVKYHGLKDKKRRLSYHDSISVCVGKLTTSATVEFDSQFDSDIARINGAEANANETARILAVVNPLRKIAKTKMHYKLESQNSLREGKGLGFSAAAFAAISLATATALDLNLPPERLSEFARLGAGSASRSLVGGFSIWYAMRNGRSYARQLASEKQLRLAMGIIPIPSDIKTDRAHEGSISSPFFKARLSEVRANLPKMLHAIESADIDQICRLAEVDSLSLHAVTMTGKDELVLMSPETIRIIRRVVALREQQHFPVWYSLDTGPSVYVNTYPEQLEAVCKDIETNVGTKVLRSGVGGPARLLNEHLY